MNKNSGYCQIGVLAKVGGVTVEAIRYYEKAGLLEKPARSEGGFRLYPRESVEKVRFIKDEVSTP